MKPADNDIVELANVLKESGEGKHDLKEGGLRFLCRQASRMIRDLRPDLNFETRS